MVPSLLPYHNSTHSLGSQLRYCFLWEVFLIPNTYVSDFFFLSAPTAFYTSQPLFFIGFLSGSQPDQKLCMVLSHIYLFCILNI